MSPRPRKVPRDTPARSIGDQVTALVTERAAIVLRMAAIDKILAGVRSALGVAMRRVEPPEVARSGPDEADSSRLATLAHPNRDEARTTAILEAIADGALYVREIAEELHQERLVVKQALQRLAKAGVLTKIGQGNGTKYTHARDVSSAPPASSGPRAVARPEPRSALRGHDVSKTNLASVEARDAAVLKYLRLHVATEDQIKTALADPSLDGAEWEAAVQASITRLTVKRLIMRQGKAWTAADPRAVQHG